MVNKTRTAPNKIYGFQLLKENGEKNPIILMVFFFLAEWAGNEMPPIGPTLAGPNNLTKGKN